MESLARKSDLVPQRHGGALSPGNPGNKGGGRPSNEFRARMREIASSGEALAYLKECVRGDHGPMVAIAAFRFAAERGYGKAPMASDGKTDKPLEVHIDFGNRPWEYSHLDELRGCRSPDFVRSQLLRRLLSPFVFLAAHLTHGHLHVAPLLGAVPSFL